MSTPTAAATAAKTARRSRRAANAPSNTPTAVTTTPTVKESTVSTIKVINTPKATPKRKPAAKRKPNKPVAAAPVETTITLTQAQLDALVAESVAKVLTMADAAKPAAVPTVKRAKPATVTVKLKMAKTTTNKVQFSYAGKEENPLVTSVYVNLPLVEKFTTSGAPVAVEFTTYVPRAKQKPQPKSKIRYTGSETTISDLYVDRALITKLGYTESNPPVVTVKVISDDEISLTFPKA